MNVEPPSRGDAVPARLTWHVTFMEDHCQKRLFSTTIGGGAKVKSSDEWRVTSDEQVAANANL